MIIHANGYSYKDDSSFAVIVDGREQYAYRGAKMTTNLCELLALKFSLIGSSGNDVEYHTNSRYIGQVLAKNDKGEFSSELTANVDLISEVRILAAKAQIIVENESELMHKAKELSRKAVGRSYDPNK